MKWCLGVCTAIALLAAGSATAGIDNANVTSYTATCVGLGTAPFTSVRVEVSLERSPNAGAGVAFHVVGSNQVVLFAGPPGLLARSEEAGTICTVTAINGEPVEEFPAPIVIIKGNA